MACLERAQSAKAACGLFIGGKFIERRARRRPSFMTTVMTLGSGARTPGSQGRRPKLSDPMAPAGRDDHHRCARSRDIQHRHCRGRGADQQQTLHAIDPQQDHLRRHGQLRRNASRRAALPLAWEFDRPRRLLSLHARRYGDLPGDLPDIQGPLFGGGETPPLPVRLRETSSQISRSGAAVGSRIR